MCEDMGGGSSGRGEVLTQACGSRKLFIYIYISVGGSVLVSRAVKKRNLIGTSGDINLNRLMCTYT